MPKRGSQKVRQVVYDYLVSIYGPWCLLNREHTIPAGERLQIDEISYAPDKFNKPDNQGLVCPSCNCWLRGQPEEVHRKIIENAKAKRLQELADQRPAGEKGRSAMQNRGSTEEGRIARQLKKARKQTGIDVPLPDFSRRQIIEYMNGSSEMKANEQYLPDFCLWLWNEIIRKGPLPEKDKFNDDVLNSGSANIDGHPSQLTLQRYLDWLCKKSLSRTKEGGRLIISFRDPARAGRIGKGK